MNALLQPVVIAVLVVVEVAVWQVRVALSTRGRKRSAALLGAVNAVLSVAAIGQVVTNLDRPANIAGYAIGVAAGVYLGVVADGRLTTDPVEHRIVVAGNGVGPGHELAACGWSVTTQLADRPAGPAAVLTLVVGANRNAQLERDLERIAPGALHTSVRLRSASRPRVVLETHASTAPAASNHPEQPVSPARPADHVAKV